MTTTTPTLTYGSYLRLDRLLALQHPVAERPGTDEALFIAVHQVHELWFRQLLTELAAARDRMLAGQPRGARLVLHRCREIERALLTTIELLDTMAPPAFLDFRDALGSASGAQSAQFLEVELLSGPADPERLEGLDWLTPAEHARLRRRMHEPNLWDAFLTVLATAGHQVLTADQRRAALVAVVRDAGGSELFDLAEALLEHDQGWALWRARHVLVVERQIGRRPGSGGSSGAAHLADLARGRFYPELWEFRSRL
ncbi:tryptophan 2,3-dioxygenase family protein [Kitasatospora sp. RB6PN24]|uniref:tryptophan 2,3-dioxygenase family protein n=1 Tax=Kitasatospora humi TaxID=2893891 RepID=UPI001E438E9F|nr:tryptophan 2,3-dioxygenase family protein [Kitasatospora humi]MCC9308528.1 tryptophan 2,3-dioxygenase family protein [Kitasatospora humi]